jgi:sporulation protein YlmC with PRC-barrel domain
MAHARVLDLHLHLLDRQVIGPDGGFICKIDDLDMEIDETGRPYITAILLGPRALGPVLGGRPGRWVKAIAQRLAQGQNEQPLRIDFALVTDIGSAITVTRTRNELNVTPLEGWIDTHIISRIPGSGHESK